MTEQNWTIRALMRWMQEDFARLGIETPRLDAELLIGHALGLQRVALYMDLDRPVSDEERSAVRRLVVRRRSHEPVAYILGMREFYGRSFQVDARVLVPRPDTEVLVDQALACIRQVPVPANMEPEVELDRQPYGMPQAQVAGEPVLEPIVEPVESDLPVYRESVLENGQSSPHPEPVAEQQLATQSPAAGQSSAQQSVPSIQSRGTSGAPSVQGKRLLDLCTGSGCIGLTLAAECPELQVDLTDLSKEALALAQVNRDALGLEGRARLFAGNLWAAVPQGAVYDVIVSNPPYISEADWAGLSPDIREHEPRMALLAPRDGYACYEALTAQARRFLAPGGHLLLEVGAGQAPRVQALCEAGGLRNTRTAKDLGGITRVVIASV